MEPWSLLYPAGVVSLLFVAVAVPLIGRRVPPNHWYGFRASKTLRSRKVWYESNAYGGRLMLWLGVLSFLAALGFSNSPGADPERSINLWGITLLAGTLVMMALWYMHLTTLDEPAEDDEFAPGSAGIDRFPLEAPPPKLLCLAFVLLGVLFIAISIPLLQGQVPPNGTYGFRTPETMRSPEAWYEANAYSAKTMIVAGAVIIIAAVGLAAGKAVSQRAYVPVMLAVLFASLGGSLALSMAHISALP